MNFRDEYRAQTIFTLLQAGVIIAGSLFLGVVLYLMGYSDRIAELPFIYRLVRNWGFLLIVIPLAWACLTIWLEREGLFNRVGTVISGFAMLFFLGHWLLRLAARASSTLVMLVE